MYSRLDRDQRILRLLELLPGVADAPIRCILREYSLADAAGQYKALSYTWNGATTKGPHLAHLISCNDAVVAITPNLFSALSGLRDTRESISLWVDSLCINQKDADERAHQVGMMRDIYANCQEVSIWLGPEDADDLCREQKIRFHGDQRDVQHISTHLAQLYSPAPELSFQKGDADVYGAFCLISILAQVEVSKIWYLRKLDYAFPIVEGLRRIIESKWWSRIWVVQETVVATQAVLHYNHLSMSWETLSRAARRCLSDRVTELLSSTLSRAYYGPTLRQLHRQVNEIDSTRAAWNAVQPLALLPLLRKFRARGASDQRDKVYALLGLVRYWGGNTPLAADYKGGLGAKWVETAKHLIRGYKSLAVLSGTIASAQRLASGYPTWLTDWSTRPLPDEADRLSTQQAYKASGDRIEAVRLHGHTLLEVSGCSIDRVTVVFSSHGTSGESLRRNVQSWRGDLPWLGHSLYGQGMTGETVNSAFWRTICADMMYVPEAATDKDKFRRARPADAVAYNDWYRVDKKRNRITSVVDGTWIDYLSNEEKEAEQRSNAFDRAVKCASRGRTFFLTEQDRMGVGPPHMQAGDGVYLLSGSRVPMILRPSRTTRTCRNKPVDRLILSEAEEKARIAAGQPLAAATLKMYEANKDVVCDEDHRNCFALVGDAYVHGTMQGDLVWEDKDRRKPRPTESICLI